MMELRIKSTAVLDTRGTIYTRDKNSTHATIKVSIPIRIWEVCEDGFLLNNGEFADRKTALRIAIEAGQTLAGIEQGGLFSYDVLWDEVE